MKIKNNKRNTENYLFVIISFILFLICISFASAELITNCEELQNMKNNLGGNYELAMDINCIETVNWNGGLGFEPIGDMNNRFNGIFDGKRYNITGLYINRSDMDYVGLFGAVDSSSEVSNVGLERINIVGDEKVGGLVGINFGEITNSYSEGRLVGNRVVGGLVGKNDDNGRIFSSYSSSSIKGNQFLGGLVGENPGSISDSYATGKVIGGGGVGGLVGNNEYGLISKSYSTAYVKGINWYGGLVGYVYYYWGIPSVVEYSFWDVQTSKQTSSLGGTGKITKLMKQRAVFENNGWDFVNTWKICNYWDYPKLKWEKDNFPCYVSSCGDGICHPDEMGSCLDCVGCKIIDGWDFVNNDEDPIDDNGHGTHCAGIAAGSGELNGVAPDAQLYAYKALNYEGRGYNSDVIASIDKAIDPNNDDDTSDHIDIISMSLGSNCTPNDYDSSCGPNDPMSRATDNAAYLGVIVAVSAGNNGVLGEGTIGSPGTARKAITVGAVDKSKNIASFSSIGPVITETGEIIYKPDLVAPGVLINSAKLGGGYTIKSGTSMAAPHVAGAAALLKQIYPKLDQADIKDILVSSAELLNYDRNTVGAGLIDALNAFNIKVSLLEITGYEINDSEGNNNSQIDMGEKINLFLKLKNSYGDIENLEASLNTSSICVNITNPLQELSNITKDSEKNTDKFVLKTNCTANQVLNFSFNYNIGGKNYTKKFNLITSSCGDKLCDDNENSTTCALDCITDSSYIYNKDSEDLTGVLTLKIQKNNAGEWADVVTVSSSNRTLAPGESLDINNVWVENNGYTARLGGNLRVYGDFKDENGDLIYTLNNSLNDSYEFNVTGEDSCEDGIPYNNCSAIKPYYCDYNLKSVENCNVCGCPAGIICLQNGSCLRPGANIKDSGKYETKQVFLISDADWKEVIGLVPVSTWTDEDGIHKYPTLIYHQENDVIDVDSIIAFLQLYSPDKVVIVEGSNAPSGLSRILIAAKPIGAGIYPNQIVSINANDYLSYWSGLKQVVYVEDNYELGVLASTYASLINAPLVIEGTSSDVDNVFISKGTICIGNVNRTCTESYDLNSLQDKYAQKTGTDKIILINPEDLNIKYNSPYPMKFWLEKTAGFLTEIYSKTSLISPFLASAKHELIYSVNSQDAEAISNSLRTKTGTGNYKYLTIIASPDAIPMSKFIAFFDDWWDNMRELDNSLYGSIDNDLYSEINTGRIFGITVSDASSYINRVLFYDEIKPSYNNKATIQAILSGYAFIARPIAQLLKNSGYDYSFFVSEMDSDYDSQQVIPEATDFEIPVTDEKMQNRNIYSYNDHGSPWGSGDLETDRIRDNNLDLFPAVVTSMSCLSCDYEHGREDLICINALRQGAMGFYGAVAVSLSQQHAIFYNEIINNDKDLGEAFRVTDYIFSLGEYQARLSDVYMLIGDPTFNPILKQGEEIGKTIVNENRAGKIINAEITFNKPIDLKEPYLFEYPSYWSEGGPYAKIYLPLLNHKISNLGFDEQPDEIIVTFNIGDKLIIKRNLKITSQIDSGYNFDYLRFNYGAYEFKDLESGFVTTDSSKGWADILAREIIIDYDTLENTKDLNAIGIRLYTGDVINPGDNKFYNWTLNHDEQNIKVNIDTVLK